MFLTAGLTVLGSLTLSAQDKVETAKIPFAFQANHKALAAGDYRVEQLNNAGTFMVRNERGESIFVSVPELIEASPSAQPHLTFACYEGNCVLSQIWMPGSNVAYGRSDAAVNRDLQRRLGMATMIDVRLTAK
jgi:hypothetical protein